MKTTEQLITEGAEYFTKTGKHLFTIYNPNGTTYYHVCLMEKDGEQYRVNISFSTNSETVYVYGSKLSSYPVPVSEYSQQYFTPLKMAKAVRQNKYLRMVLEDLKTKVYDKLRPTGGNYNMENGFKHVLVQHDKWVQI